MAATPMVARSALWNLFGQAAPLVVALFAIPPLVHGLGTERFGVLSLVWVLIGYLGLFDLGLARALTRSIAERRARGPIEGLADTAWTALAVTLLLGLAVAAVGVAAAGPLVERVLRVPSALRSETARSLTVLAAFMPFVLGTAALRGVLEAHHRFGLANALRVPMGVYQFLAPLAALALGGGLVAIVWWLAIGRAVAWVAHLAAALRVMPELRTGPRWRPAELPALVYEGGWMTVSNVVGPVIVYLDRFLLGAIASLEAVAWYTTPFEVVSRLLVVPAALAGVLFPSFAAHHGRDPARVAHLHRRGARAVLVLIVPPAIALCAFAPELLTAWVGPEFAAHGAAAMRWLAAGVLLNSLAHVPFTLLQAAGRSRVTAGLHLLEIPLYALAAWWAIRSAGATGAAIAWAARGAFDAVALFALARRESGATLSRAVPDAGWLVAALATLAALSLTPALFLRAAIAAAALVVFAWVGWIRLLTPEDRAWMRARLAGRGAGAGEIRPGS